MKTLWLATPPRSPDDVLELEISLLGALLECLEVIGALAS
jgi:hypothetical protein